MIKRFIFSCIYLSLIFCLLPAISHTETEEDFWEFTFGTVARISKDYIALLEYDLIEEGEIEVIYEINDSTEFVNFDALSNLRLGDEIEIEFSVQNNKRIAVEIVKEAEEDIRQNEELGQETISGPNEENSDKI